MYVWIGLYVWIGITGIEETLAWAHATNPQGATILFAGLVKEEARTRHCSSMYGKGLATQQGCKQIFL